MHGKGTPAEENAKNSGQKNSCGHRFLPFKIGINAYWQCQKSPTDNIPRRQIVIVFLIVRILYVESIIQLFANGCAWTTTKGRLNGYFAGRIRPHPFRYCKNHEPSTDERVSPRISLADRAS